MTSPESRITRQIGFCNVREYINGEWRQIMASVDCRECGARAGDLHTDSCDVFMLYSDKQ